MHLCQTENHMLCTTTCPRLTGNDLYSSPILFTDLIEFNYVWMVQHFQYFHLAENFLQVSFIELSLIDDLYSNLHKQHDDISPNFCVVWVYHSIFHSQIRVKRLWHHRSERYRAFSLPGQFAPRSESANRTLANSLPGTFAPWPFRSPAFSLPGQFAPWPFRTQAFSLPGTKVLWNFRSLELSLPGTFAPLMCPSPFIFAVLHLHSRPLLRPRPWRRHWLSIIFEVLIAGVL